MSLFKFKADSIIVTKEISELKWFKKIAGHKNSATYFAYIFHLCDYKSPYAIFSEEEKQKKLKDELLDGKEPPKFVIEAIEAYKDLSKTDSIRLLEAARTGVRNLREYFETEDPNYSKDPGKAAKNLMSNLNNVGKILKSLEEWEEQVKKEQGKADTRKGVVLNEFNAG